MPPVKSESECEEFFTSELYKQFTYKTENLEKQCPVKPVSIQPVAIAIQIH